MSKSRPINYCLILIFILFFIFRFYNFSDWISFGMDQEYEAFIAKNIITGRHFPLIGVNASDTGLYLGPFFIYFASIFFAFFKGNPIGWAAIGSTLGVIVCYLVYRVGKEIFSQKVGYFASLIYAGSFLVAFYERQFWNPMLVPIFSLITGYLLYQILHKHTSKLIWLAVVFGLAIQTHLSMLIFTPLIFYVIWMRKKDILKKNIILALLVFIILQSPLIIFDIRHNFTNSRAALSLIKNFNKSTEVKSNFQQRKNLFLSSLGRFIWVPIGPDLFLESGQCKELATYRKNSYPEVIFLALVGIGIFIFNNAPKSRSKIIIGILILTLAFAVLYNREIFEYYFLFFFPWLAIILGNSLDLISTRKRGSLITVILLVVFIISNLLTLFTAKFSYSYKDKLNALAFAKKYVREGNYDLEALGECTRFGGYRYLFEYYVGKPAHSYMDSYFSWLYYEEDLQTDKEVSVILLSMIDPRDNSENIAKWQEVRLQYLSEYKLQAENKFGNIGVLILSPIKK